MKSEFLHIMAKSLDPAAEKIAKERLKNLDLAIGHIKKEYGEGSIMRMGDDHRVDVDVIPTGNLLIDRALGVGDFHAGGWLEVSGLSRPVRPR